MWSLRRSLPMATDQEPITQTVQGYFGGGYDADAAPMGRALRPGVARRSPAEDGGAILAKQLMLQACAEGEGTRAAGRRVKIGIADVCGAIASAAVRSAPYREYVHLIRTGDGWTIVDALWLPR
jgi:Putative lumazine-binding